MEKSIIYTKAYELATMACQHIEGVTGKRGTSASFSWWLNSLLSIGATLHLAQEKYSNRSLSIKLYVARNFCNQSIYATKLLQTVDLLQESEASLFSEKIEEIRALLQHSIEELLSSRKTE